MNNRTDISHLNKNFLNSFSNKDEILKKSENTYVNNFQNKKLGRVGRVIPKSKKYFKGPLSEEKLKLALKLFSKKIDEEIKGNYYKDLNKSFLLKEIEDALRNQKEYFTQDVLKKSTGNDLFLNHFYNGSIKQFKNIAQQKHLDLSSSYHTPRGGQPYLKTKEELKKDEKAWLSTWRGKFDKLIN